MTVGVGYRVPGLGAVLCSDGRVTHDDLIVSDSTKKYIVCGSTVVLIAGTVGQVWRQLQERPPRSFAAFREALAAHADEQDWLAYDRRSDRLWSGELQLSAPFGALGTGSSIALGALEALPLAKTLEAAERAALSAVRIACRRQASCGGRIRTVIVPGKRGTIVVR